MAAYVRYGTAVPINGTFIYLLPPLTAMGDLDLDMGLLALALALVVVAVAVVVLGADADLVLLLDLLTDRFALLYRRLLRSPPAGLGVRLSSL